MRDSLLLMVLALTLVAGCKRSQPIEPIARAAASGADDPALPAPDPADWPWWRGPQADGKSPGRAAPLHWSTSENIAWKAEVPGGGHASPTVWGDRIFVAAADEKRQVQSVLCYDRARGTLRWNTEVHRGGFMGKHEKNSHASATPACDGERVYAPFLIQGALWVTALDLDGEIVWQTKAGGFASQHGYGSSPALHGSLVIVNGDNPGSAFVAALDRKTGQIVWRTPRPNKGSYSTPIVATVAGRPQLLLSGGSRVTAYDPGSGQELWHTSGPSDVTAATMAYGQTLVYASGGFPQKELVAIRADGAGDVSASHVAWRTGQGVTYVPSMLLEAGRLFVVSDNGIATCFDAESGRQVWKERLGGNFTASPVLAGGHIYVPNESGTTFVFRAADRYQAVAQNELGEPIFATPVICGGQILLRTKQHLYLIGETQASGGQDQSAAEGAEAAGGGSGS